MMESAPYVSFSVICWYLFSPFLLLHFLFFFKNNIFLLYAQLIDGYNVSDVGNIVRDTEKESIRNRGCRVVANLCQTAACCDVIHEDHADLFGSVVSNLSKTADKDCKVTYCRTIRLVFVCTRCA